MDKIMAGKVCLVTGATSGVGLVTARELARQGATLIGVGRNPEKCSTVAANIRTETGNPSVEFLVADLSSQAQIRQLAPSFKKTYSRLDVLVNNAGAFFLRRQESPDGIEMTFALNHLSYFMVTILLVEELLAGTPARVINVASDSHQGARMNFADLELHKGYFGWNAYGQSKLANVLFTYEFARRMQGRNLTCNALTPGFVATNIGANNGSLVRLFLKVAHKMGARTPEQGAQTSIYLATSPEVESISGKYFYDRQLKSSSPLSHDEDIARQLWTISEQMTGVSL